MTIPTTDHTVATRVAGSPPASPDGPVPPTPDLADQSDPSALGRASPEFDPPALGRASPEPDPPPARPGHPTLLPAVRRLWRDHYRLQLGTDPGRAVVLELADPSAARLLDLLDGSRTEPAVMRAATAAGIGAREASELVAVLRSAGLVIDITALAPSALSEPARRRLHTEASALAMRARATEGARTCTPATALRRRRDAHVLVTGRGPLVVPVAAALASSGVGHVAPDVSGITRAFDAAPAGLLPSDACRPRGIAAADALRRAAPDIELTPLPPDQASFAIVVGTPAPATLTAFALSNRLLPHLAVDIREGTIVVGPLVRPGVSPCLNCLDLHRRDRDPAWPRLAAQLRTAPEMADPVTATTALAGIAFAAAEALAHIDGGQPMTVGATVEISGPGEYVRRSWTTHPRCGCTARGAPAPRPATTPYQDSQEESQEPDHGG